MEELIDWGARCPTQDADAFRSERARHALAAVRAHRAYELIELRHLEHQTLGPCDVVVATCTNQEIPNRNPVGIRVREPLAFTVPVDEKRAPEMRALRPTFPLVPHLNGVGDGEPKSLCVIAEAWGAARRTWTPQHFLNLTSWWLKDTALGRLHRPDQPVERVYFDLGWELVLPPGYDGTEPAGTRLDVREVIRGNRCTLVATYSTSVDLSQVRYVPVHLAVKRAHGVVDSVPATLGRLVDQWDDRGVALADLLIARLAEMAGGGLADFPDQQVLLVLEMAITREAGGAVERRDTMAFLIPKSFVSLAYAMGAVFRSGLLYFAPSTPSPTAAADNANDWRPIPILPLDGKRGLTREGARAQTGIRDEGAEAERVLIGAGSLGSALADIWGREGWGRWTFVDPDHVEPHNLARHRAAYDDIGRFKVDVVRELVDGAAGQVHTVSIPTSATATDDEALTGALAAAELIVDVSTTLDVPRELSARADCRRMASAFMTPSGQASVVLMEDHERALPLHLIEPQYYRQVLRADWGSTHLTGHQGYIAVGAGCRDVAMVMSPEIVELHAAILSRQIRTLSANPGAALRVWVTAPDGSVAAHAAPVRNARTLTSESWRVVLDDEVIDGLLELRAERTPKETGGIIVGYTDHVSRTIYVVDLLPPPADSVEDETSFVRGADGLTAAWQAIQTRTANIVTYIGEWHSHPPKHGASPSGDDMALIGELGVVLARDGEPALMVIVAEKEISVWVCASDGTFAEISAAGLSR